MAQAVSRRTCTSSGVIVAAPLGSSPHRRYGVSAATTPPGGVRR